MQRAADPWRRGVVRLGRHRTEDRVRAGLPAAGHLALPAPGHRHHPAGRRRGLRRHTRCAPGWPATSRSATGPDGSPKGPRSSPSRSAWPGKSPTICWPTPGRHGHRGPSPRSCPACRSWSWPWGPPWPTCCAPTLTQTIRRTAGPDHQPSCGPCPGPQRTKTDQTADDRMLTGTGPRGGTRTVRTQDHRTALGSRGPARGPRSRSWSGPALSPDGLPQRGSQYHDERCVAAESRAPTRP
jgi:hypothetical protein